MVFAGWAMLCEATYSSVAQLDCIHSVMEWIGKSSLPDRGSFEELFDSFHSSLCLTIALWIRWAVRSMSLLQLH